MQGLYSLCGGESDWSNDMKQTIPPGSEFRRRRRRGRRFEIGEGGSGLDIWGGREEGHRQLFARSVDAGI